MGCVNSQKSKNINLNRQAAYATIFNDNIQIQQYSTTERNQRFVEPQKNFQVPSNINKQSESQLKRTIQRLNLNKVNQFKQNVETLKKYQKRDSKFYNSHQKDFDEIMQHIQQQTLTLQILLNKNDQLQMPLLDILYIKNNEGKSLIELILCQIDNYEIISQIVLGFNLTEDHLQAIAIPLFRKLKLLNSNLNVEKAIKFLKDIKQKKIIEIILNVSKDRGNSIIIKHFRNIFNYIDKNNKMHLKYLKILSQMTSGVESFQILQQEYIKASIEFKLNNLIISKKIKKGNMEDLLKMKSELQELKINIFHQVALNKKWDIFNQYSNCLIQNPNISQFTSFMMFFQNAPFDMILKYIQQYPNQLIQGIEYSTSQGLNLIHCLCLNKNVSQILDNNCLEIMDILKNQKNFNQLLLQPYQDQIPLIFYLNVQKIVHKKFLDFLGKNLKKDFDFYKLDTLAQILGEELKFREIKKQQKSIKYLQRKKKHAFNQNYFKLELELQQELKEQFNLYYLHYVQLMKIMIKRKFSIDYSHLNEFFTFTSNFPYDLGTSHHSFLQIALRNLNENFILQELKKFNFQNHLKSYKNELEKLNIQLPKDYSLEAQILVKLVYLKMDIADQSSQLHKEINQIILQQLQKDPKLLWARIYGNSQIKYKGFSTNLYQLIKQLLDVLFIRDVLLISFQNNLDCTSIDIMKEFVFQELLLKQVATKEIDLRAFSDSFPRQIQFKEEVIEKKVKVNSKTKSFQIKFYIWSLGLEESQSKMDIGQFYLFLQHLDRKCISKLIKCQTIKITMKLLQVLLEQEITMPLINEIINLNPQYFIPKIWWLTQNCDLKTSLKIISIKHQIKPIIISKLKINQLDLIFDWQMYGIQFKILRYSKQLLIQQDLSTKSQLIIFQLLNRLLFVTALAIDDYFNVELSTYLKNSQVDKKKETISQIQLHMMIQNLALKNIQLFIDYFNLDAYSLIYILSLNHFSNNNFFSYTPSEVFQINKFNFNNQVQQLLKLDFKYQQEICPIFIYRENRLNQNEEPRVFQVNDDIEYDRHKKPYCILLIKHFNYETFSMFDQKLRTSLYRRQNFQITFEEIKDQRIIEILIDDLIQILRQEFEIHQITHIITDPLTISINNNSNLAEILCRCLSKEELKLSKQLSLNFLEKLSLISNQMCIQYLEKLTLKNYEFLHVYYQALAKENIPLLNHLINYYHENQLSMPFIYNYKYISQNVKNYKRALQEKYYLVLDVKQYQLLYNTVKLNINTIFNHIQMFILLGYVEQLKFIRQQPTIQDQIQNFYFEYLFAKKMCIENDLGIRVNLFSGDIIKKQFQLELFFLKKFKRTSEKFCIFSFSKQICSFNFYQQKIDYLETFQILDQIMGNSKEQSQQLTQFNELYSLIINPQAKQITLQKELIQFISKLIMKAKKLNKFILDRYDEYISLFNINSKNVEIIFDFRKPKQAFLKFITQILIQYISLIKEKKSTTLKDYEKLTEYILKYQIKNEKLIECLQLGLQNYYLTKLDNTTLFYVQNKVNLLPKNDYNFSKNSHFYNRYNVIKKIMNLDEINLEKMTPIQVFLSKGKVDHIFQINYSNSNLMAALISNNFNTIQTILKKHQNPQKICSDFNLFHYMIIFQNEKNIISFFHEYIENYIQDINKLMIFQNESILQTIVLQRKCKIFDLIINQYLLRLTDSQTHLKIIQQHLQMKVQQSDFMIYQLGICQKSYFIVDYLDGIIQADEIQQLISSVNLNLVQNLLNSQQGVNKFNKFTKYYIDSLQHVLQSNLSQKKVEKQNKDTKQMKIVGVQKQFMIKIKKHNKLLNLLEIELACIYKIFGFNKFILKYLKKNQKFFSLFENDPQDILIAIDTCKGHPKLIEFYLNNFSQQDFKANLEQIVKQCQKFYLIQDPIFYKSIITFPEQFINILNPSDYNLEICLLLSAKLKQTKILENFIKNQLQLQQTQSQNLERIDFIQENYLFMMSLFLNDFSLPILKTGYQHISVELLVKSLKFLEQNFEQEFEKLSNEGLNYVINLLDKEIIINNQNTFQEYINSNDRGYSIIRGMLLIQQIEVNVHFFLFKLPKWANFSNKVEISFDNIPIMFNNQNYILPLKFNNDVLELNELLINEFIPVLKQLKYERIMNEELIKFEDFKQKWPQYDFQLLINNINIAQIPFYCLENLDELNLKQEIINQENQKEKANFYENIIFFKSLLNPLENSDENHFINDLQAPHKNLDFDESTIQESKYIQKYQNQQNKLSQNKLRKKVQIIKEFLPINKYKSRFTNIQNMILIEFYHYYYPQTTVILLQPLSKKEYYEQYNPKAILQLLIYKFKQYHDNVKELIKSQQYEKWKINLPYYIENDQFIYQEILFIPYSIQFILFKFQELVHDVRKLNDDERKLTEYDSNLIKWRINVISVLEVLVKSILESSFLENKCVDIFSIIDSICQWKNLQQILFQIIYNNLISVQITTKLFQIIYVEFKEEKSSYLNETQNDSFHILDQIFQFEKTEYQIYQKILIITLNVFVRKDVNLKTYVQLNKQQRNLYNKQSKALENSFNLYNVINDSDFYFDIFSPPEFIEYFFNRQQIDKYINDLSIRLNRFMNKDVVLIVNYTQLKDLYENQILEIKKISDRRVMLQKQYEIQSELLRLKDFFISKVENSLFEQLQSQSFEQLFEVYLSILLQSLRQNNQFLQSTQSNVRRIIKATKSKVIERMAQFSEYNFLRFQFGFQLTPTYYQQRAKIGDICFVCFLKNGKLTIEPYQLIRIKDSEFSFFSLQNQRRALTQEQIDDQFRFDAKQKQYGFEMILELILEEIISLIWFTPQWPNEQNFSSEILNLFFLDQNSNLLACHEKKFLHKMQILQQIENEQQKQIFLDDFLGQNLIPSYAQFLVTQIIPIIPNQINYNFKFNDQKQQCFVKENNEIFITISNDDFILDKLSFGNYNTACYFDSKQKLQKYLKKLNKFAHQIQGMSKLILKICFEDELNKNPQFYLSQFFHHINIFEEFELGFQEFCNEIQISQINNSLQQLFDVSSFTQLKQKIFCQIVKQIEFHFKLNQNDEKIKLENGNLSLYMYLLSNDPKSQNLLISDISYFFSKMIIQHEQFGISHLIILDQFYDIQILDQPSPDQYKSMANTILLIRYLFQLIQLKQNQQQNIKVTFILQINPSNKRFYEFQIQNSQIILYYNCLKDFSLEVFLLDYLNNFKFQGEVQYENLINDNYLLNCQILHKQIIFKDNLYYPQIKKEDKNLYISKDFSQFQILDGKLDPQEQEKGIIIFQNKGIYQKIITFKSNQKYMPLQKYFKQIENKQIYGQIFYFLVSGINEKYDLDTQLNTLQVRFNANKKKIQHFLNHYQRNTHKLKVNTKLITTNIAMVELIVNGVESVKIKSKSPQLLISTLKNQNYTKSTIIQFKPIKIANQNQNLLDHIGILIEQSKENQIYKPIEFRQKIQNNLLEENQKLIKFLLKGMGQKVEFIQKSNLLNKQIDLIEIQNVNTISYLNSNQISVASLCGQKRTDFLEFLEISDNQIHYENGIFVHSQFQQIKIYPQIFKETLGLKFQWQPTIKGIYNLFLGGLKINGQFIVLANKIDSKRCTIKLIEDTKNIRLYQKIKFAIKLRDHLNNIYGDIEQRLNEIQPKVETISEFSEEKIEINGPNKEGEITLQVSFSQKENVEHQPEDVQVKVSILDKYLSNQFHLEGLTLEMRIIKYYEKLKSPKVEKVFKIDRAQFPNEILKLAKDKFQCIMKIKFVNEEGSDDGGLRREFYNKVGQMIKSPIFGFFKKNKKSQTYFFSSQFNQNQNRKQYALIFGKLIANSIINKEIIGVKFAPQFWKLIFNKPISYEDLEGIMEENEFQNYINLNQMQNDDIEMLYLNFEITKGEKTIQLVPNGNQINLTAQNRDQYLQLIAKYYICDEFQEIIQELKDGFESVLKIDLLNDCFDVTEMHTLTEGADNIQPQQVLDLVKFEGGSDQMESFFKKFILSLDEIELRDFLQFTTGSPQLPWNAKPTIQIEFSKQAKETNLPKSSTCFYKLTIPYYQSYEDFKKKMEIAIENGQEGFGQY
ncbi:unnamed protein product [Paramecium sonneborni]|uniref:HECT domain-containing protein n=1 Tax=Paramecium sonneborni TaxID=65129 RepID=A0A8S1R9F3_9CILI|nr:unnamed protein product [Paramecium sonneborni]